MIYIYSMMIIYIYICFCGKSILIPFRHTRCPLSHPSPMFTAFKETGADGLNDFAWWSGMDILDKKTWKRSYISTLWLLGELRSRDEGYFPILNEELFGTLSNPQKNHRVADWSNGIQLRNPWRIFFPKVFHGKLNLKSRFLWAFFKFGILPNFQGLIFLRWTILDLPKGAKWV